VPATPSPTAAPTEEARQPLKVVDFGFSESDQLAVYFGVVVENPNQTWAAFGTGVDITFLDESGDEVTSLRGLFGRLAPGETSAIGDFSPSATGADSMEVELVEPEWVPMEAEPEVLTVSDVATRTSGNTMTTSGTITNSSQQAFDFIRIQLIYRDDDGKIIGGWGDSASVPAGGETEFEIRALEPLPVETTEVYLQYR
jgi:hypothetical protein